MKIFTHLKLSEDVYWIIEAKIRLVGEIHELFVKSMPKMGRSSYCKKRRAKTMEVYYKCIRWTCNKHCKSKGVISVNREDKIHFIKDVLSSKEFLDDII